VSERRSGWLVSCGRVAYGRALAWQEQLHAARVAGCVPDTVLLVEHNPVYTLGRNADEGNILLDAATLEGRGIEVHRIGRGGQVTYHGPGQLVGYPIVSLRGLGAAGYVSLLETVLIALLGDYGIEARTDPINRGVWVGQEKVAAIGVRISRGVSMHGFALNVAPNLADYAGIVPCGIVGRGVTSMARLGFTGSMDEVTARVGERLCEALHLGAVRKGVAELESELAKIADSGSEE
jgi:lipoyl(octanoyl) transferase